MSLKTIVNWKHFWHYSWQNRAHRLLSTGNRKGHPMIR